MPGAGELPAQLVDWAPDPRRAVLLVHDMQRYFLRFFPAGREPVDTLVRHAALLRRTCARLGVPVAFTAQPGAMTDRQRGLLKAFWGPGMSASPEDRGIVAELGPCEGDAVFTKWRYSAFHQTGLLDLLRDRGRDQLIVCGVYAHIGCLASVVDAFSHDVQPFLVVDAVADLSEAGHRAALFQAAEFCAATPTTRQVVAALEGRAGPDAHAAATPARIDVGL